MHWLRFVLDEARLRGLALATLPEALERHEPVERPIEPSSWGRTKDLSSWDHASVADIVWAQRGAELRTVAAAGGARAGDPALERAARELLALQSSDWAFQLTYELSDDYPRRRIGGHVEQLDAALAALTDSGPAPDPQLRNLAPQLDVSPLFGI
jgi:1,4-alpha-glucan branching enzyme